MDLGTIHVHDGLGFGAQVREFGHRHLHAEGHLLLSDGGLDLGVPGEDLLLLVDLRHEVQHLVAGLAVDARGVGEKGHRVAHRLKGDALMLRRKKAGAPETTVERLDVDLPRPEGRCQHDEFRQVSVHRTQPIAQPGAHAGLAGYFGTGTEKSLGRIVIDGLGMGGLDQADVIRHGRDMGQQLAPVDTVLALARELEDRSTDHLFLAPCHGGDTLATAYFFRERLAVQFFQVRLIVKQVQLARCTCHKKEDDPLGLRCVMQATRRCGRKGTRHAADHRGA